VCDDGPEKQLHARTSQRKALLITLLSRRARPLIIPSCLLGERTGQKLAPRPEIKMFPIDNILGKSRESAPNRLITINFLNLQFDFSISARAQRSKEKKDASVSLLFILCLLAAPEASAVCAVN
jgi:hypothetical protein